MRKLILTVMMLVGLAASVASVQTPAIVAGTAKVVVRLDAALDALVDPNAKLEIISTDFAKGDSPATEGPVWIKQPGTPDGGYFVFTDSRRTQLTRWSPGTGLAPAHDLKKLLGTPRRGAH